MANNLKIWGETNYLWLAPHKGSCIKTQNSPKPPCLEVKGQGRWTFTLPLCFQLRKLLLPQVWKVFQLPIHHTLQWATSTPGSSSLGLGHSHASPIRVPRGLWPPSRVRIAKDGGLWKRSGERNHSNYSPIMSSLKVKQIVSPGWMHGHWVCSEVFCPQHIDLCHPWIVWVMSNLLSLSLWTQE